MLKMRPSKRDHACDANLSLLGMQAGDTSGSEWRQKNRTEGAGSSLGEQARSRLRRTLNLPGGRLGIPRHNATAFGGGRMSNTRHRSEGTSRVSGSSRVTRSGSAQTFSRVIACSQTILEVRL